MQIRLKSYFDVKEEIDTRQHLKKMYYRTIHIIPTCQNLSFFDLSWERAADVITVFELLLSHEIERKYKKR